MSTPVVFGGVTYNVPAFGDTGYAQGAGNLSSYLIAIATGTLQRSGGSFILTNDVNFGSNFGLLADYFTSITANPATAGRVRLAKTDTIDWRNNANGADLALGINGSDQLTFNGTVISFTAGNLTDAGTDGITVTNGTGAVLGSGTSLAQHVADASHNGYLSSTDWSTFNGKLDAALTSAHLFIGNGSNIATDVALSGDATIDNTGVLTLKTVNSNVGSFTSADITVDAQGRITAAANGAGGSGITQLTGDVTAGPGSGSQAATLANTTVTPGSYTATNLTVDSKGRITAASNGSAGASGGLLQRQFIATTTSNTTTSTSYVNTDLTISYTPTGAGHDMDLIMSGVVYVNTGGSGIRVTIAIDGNDTSLVAVGMFECTHVSAAEITPFSYTFPSVTLTGTHTYTVRIRSLDGNSVQLGTGDVTTNIFIIKEYNL